jgi:hypothetical protein
MFTQGGGGFIKENQRRSAIASSGSARWTGRGACIERGERPSAMPDDEALVHDSVPNGCRAAVASAMRCGRASSSASSNRRWSI